MPQTDHAHGPLVGDLQPASRPTIALRFVRLSAAQQALPIAVQDLPLPAALGVLRKGASPTPSLQDYVAVYADGRPRGHRVIG